MSTLSLNRPNELPLHTFTGHTRRVPAQGVYALLGTDMPEEVLLPLILPWRVHRTELREIDFSVFELRCENGDGGKEASQKRPERA